jgi:uncharacterized membrane protein HdeD (DUF308 family)
MSATLAAAHAELRGARLFLALAGAVLAVYGVLLFADPALLGRLVGLRFEGANAPVEIRAFYGGLELGLAAFFVAAARRPAWVEPALAAFALAFGAAGVARAAGIVQFGFTGPSQPLVAGIEIAAAVFAAWLRRRSPEGLLG